MQKCRQLKILNLAGNKTITKVAKFYTNNYVNFDNLETLNLTMCTGLQKIILNAPKLQHLLASDCFQLSDIQLTGATSLKTLDLTNARRLPHSIFESLSTLNQAQIKGTK